MLGAVLAVVLASVPGHYAAPLYQPNGPALTGGSGTQALGGVRAKPRPGGHNLGSMGDLARLHISRAQKGASPLRRGACFRTLLAA